MRKACCNRIIFYNLSKQIMPLNCCTVQRHTRSFVSPLTFVFKQTPAYAPQYKHNESKWYRIMGLTERGPKFEVIAIKIVQNQSSIYHKEGLYSETNNGQRLSALESINLLVSQTRLSSSFLEQKCGLLGKICSFYNIATVPCRCRAANVIQEMVRTL